MLLPLRLRFLITSVTLWSFCRGEKNRFSIVPRHYQHLGEHPRRTSHTHCTAVGLEGHVSRAAVALLQFVHWVGPSPTAGDISPMETLPGLPEAAATAVASPETLRQHRSCFFDSWGDYARRQCVRTHSQTSAELSLLLLAFAWFVGAPVCSDVPAAHLDWPRHQNHPTPDRASLRDMPGTCRCSPPQSGCQ